MSSGPVCGSRCSSTPMARSGCRPSTRSPNRPGCAVNRCHRWSSTQSRACPSTTTHRSRRRCRPNAGPTCASRPSPDATPRHRPDTTARPPSANTPPVHRSTTPTRRCPAGTLFAFLAPMRAAHRRGHASAGVALGDRDRGPRRHQPTGQCGDAAKAGPRHRPTGPGAAGALDRTQGRTVTRSNSGTSACTPTGSCGAGPSSKDQMAYPSNHPRSARWSAEPAHRTAAPRPALPPRPPRSARRSPATVGVPFLADAHDAAASSRSAREVRCQPRQAAQR